MKETIYRNLTSYESSSLLEIKAICAKYGINENRIYWDNFNFYLDVFHSETK